MSGITRCVIFLASEGLVTEIVIILAVLALDRRDVGDLLTPEIVGPCAAL
jgi:hypothetical protein